MSESTTASKYIVGIYKDDNQLLGAVDALVAKGVKIANVFTPFPVHHLDEKMGLKESKLPDAAFLFGCIGFLSAVSMQVLMYTVDWPVNIGGKPHLPIPSFVPISFELTVLFASLGMVGTYLYVNRLAPGIDAELADLRQTDDHFVICIKSDSDASDAKAREILNGTGAAEVRDQFMKRC